MVEVSPLEIEKRKILKVLATLENLPIMPLKMYILLICKKYSLLNVSQIYGKGNKVKISVR